MQKYIFSAIVLSIALIGLSSQMTSQSNNMNNGTFQPLSYELADQKADSVLALMTTEEKISYIGGDRAFFIRPLPRLNLAEVYMTDATQGVHIREKFRDNDLSKHQLEKSTAFPCPLALTATWNTNLANEYATAVGEECRGSGTGILLGPGMNSYRISQCGRNFEYFGEDPFLRARFIEAYVKGVQSTGTVATLKHFVANNTEFFRRKSNSLIDERTLHEIYLPPFKAGVDAGAQAVMTSYNLLNGEWCGESDYVIDNLLRKELGFKWLVMTDWWSVYNGEKVVKSGQNLEMPQSVALKDVDSLLKVNKVKIEDINRMVKSILRTYFAMKLSDQKMNLPDSAMYDDHESIALQTAREAIVLLKNDNKILPLKNDLKKILLTGEYVEKLAKGGGSAEVKGFHQRQMLSELKAEFGNRLIYEKNPSTEQIKSADVVLCNIGTDDSEGWDRAFALPEDQEKRVVNCVNNNPNTVVIVTSGSGIRMTDWNNKARAILYAWYGGQIGNKALAEILSGKTNPSGKLPITIEKEFKDSPGYGYIPAGEALYTDWKGNQEKLHPVYDVNYKEGVFVGYRWYESKKIQPLYPFGYGLSYTTFDYSDLMLSKETMTDNDTLMVSFAIKNTGSRNGMETAQIYIEDVESSVPRPIKELKAFKKVELHNGESVMIQVELNKHAFAFWNPKTKDWYVEKGKFVIHVGAASNDIRLSKEIAIH
jgi:beta-glucosidase